MGVMECSMSSAIVSAPGGAAGQLCVGYPMTGVSASQATETMRIQLRTYLGAVVTNPESVFVLPNVTFHGLKNGHQRSKLFDVTDLLKPEIQQSMANGSEPVDMCTAFKDPATHPLPPHMKELIDGACASGAIAFPGTLRRTTKAAKQINMVTENTGHLGV